MANAQQKSTSYSLKTCKLQDTVKLMSINMSKAYRKNHSRNESTPREIKKWTKMDVGLFEYDMPVIKYCPKNANMSSSSVTVQLNDIVHVEHISKFSKPNVLMIDFPLHSLLLSFKSKERMEMWMSELLCLTNIYTLLLYDTSNTKVKLGYYQLRFMLDKVTVYDAITRKKAWTWEVSHICGYSKTKSTGSKIEIGKESSVNGIFYFTGKQVKLFCAHLQKVSHKIAQKKLNHGATMPLYKHPALSVENLLLPHQTPYTIPRFSNNYVTTVPYNLHSSAPMNLNKPHLNNNLCQLRNTPSISGSSRRTSFSDAASISSFEAHSVSISHSTSLNSFKDNCQTKQQINLIRKTVSLNDINSTEADEDYVVPSTLPLIKVLCSNEYLTILPNKVNCYEEVTVKDSHYESLYFEQQYSSTVDSMAYDSPIVALKSMCVAK